MRRTSRLRAVAAACGALAVVAGCTASVISGHGATRHQAPSSAPASSIPPAPTPPPARFTDCSSGIKLDLLGLSTARLAQLSFECATVSVPLDYADPSGKQIQLVLLRVHDAHDHSPTGSLLVNPGGPGGSGVNLALGLLKKLPATILAHFDLVGFDPRGVGLSAPIDCLTDAQQDRFDAASPDPRTSSGYAEAQALARQYAVRCRAKIGPDLAQYDTVQTARDMDQIRQAVGDDTLNYLGFSYGTELGAQYIHLFPHRVRVAVLDGAVDPLNDYPQMLTHQLQGFDEAFSQFAAWCSGDDRCRPLGDARAAATQILAAAQRAPIPSSADARHATASLVSTGIAQALYSRSLWGQLGQALVEARAGDAKGLLQLADEYYQRFNGHYANINDVYNVVECNDSKPGPPDAVARATLRGWYARYPLFAVPFVSQLLVCQQWQADRTVPPLPSAPDAAHTVLVIGNLHDPATPYQGAKDLTRTLGNARLLTWDGEGHTSYLEGSSCIDDYVDRYLVQGALPPPRTTCR